MRARTWWAPAAAGLIALLLSLAFIRTGSWSIFDEVTHFDYVVKIAEDRRLPKVNDVLGQTALKEAVCAKAPGFAALAPACGADAVDPSLTPYRGQSTATGYLPFSYAFTGAGAWILHSLPGDASWLTSARLVGALYLAIVAMLIVAVSRRLGASTPTALSAGILAASMPMVLLQFSTVNNDAMAVLCSLGAVWVYLRLRGSPMAQRSLCAFAVATLGMLVKETAVVGVLAVAVLSMRDVVVNPPPRALGVARVIGSAVIAVLIPWVLRTAIYPVVVGANPDNGLQNAAIIAAQGQPPANLVAGNAFLSAITALQIPEGVLAGVWFAVAAQALWILATGIPVAMVLRTGHRSQWRSDRRLLSALTLVTVPAFTFGFLLMLQVTRLPAFFQPRYLLPTIVMAIPVAFAWIRPAWGRAVLVLAGGFAGSVGIALLIAPTWTG